MAIKIGIILLAAGSVLSAQPKGAAGPPEWSPRIVGAEAGRTGPLVKGAPFSADIVTETTQALADGDHVRQTSTSRLYRDSEGRTRREQSLSGLGALASGAKLPPVIFINDPVGGANYALSPTEKTATKSTGGRGFGQMGRGMAKQDAGPGRRMRGSQSDAARPNMKVEALGHQTIEGLPADGTRTTMTIPAGQIGNERPILIVSETWYSPDLQATILVKRSDPRSGDTVTRYTNISRTEPAHSLFEVPPDFKITDSPGRGGLPTSSKQ